MYDDKKPSSKAPRAQIAPKSSTDGRAIVSPAATTHTQPSADKTSGKPLAITANAHIGDSERSHLSGRRVASSGGDNPYAQTKTGTGVAEESSRNVVVDNNTDGNNLACSTSLSTDKILPQLPDDEQVSDFEEGEYEASEASVQHANEEWRKYKGELVKIGYSTHWNTLLKPGDFVWSPIDTPLTPEDELDDESAEARDDYRVQHDGPRTRKCRRVLIIKVYKTKFQGLACTSRGKKGLKGLKPGSELWSALVRLINDWQMDLVDDFEGGRGAYPPIVLENGIAGIESMLFMELVTIKKKALIKRAPERLSLGSLNTVLDILHDFSDPRKDLPSSTYEQLEDNMARDGTRAVPLSASTATGFEDRYGARRHFHDRSRTRSPYRNDREFERSRSPLHRRRYPDKYSGRYPEEQGDYYRDDPPSRNTDYERTRGRRQDRRDEPTCMRDRNDEWRGDYPRQQPPTFVRDQYDDRRGANPRQQPLFDSRRRNVEHPFQHSYLQNHNQGTMQRQNPQPDQLTANATRDLSSVEKNISQTKPTSTRDQSGPQPITQNGVQARADPMQRVQERVAQAIARHQDTSDECMLPQTNESDVENTSSGGLFQHAIDDNAQEGGQDGLNAINGAQARAPKPGLDTRLANGISKASLDV